MAIYIRSKPTAAALLALSGLGASPLLADGKFIVQPSMHKPTAVSLQPLQPPQTEAVTQKPATGGLVAQRLSFKSLAAPAKSAPLSARPSTGMTSTGIPSTAIPLTAIPLTAAPSTATPQASAADRPPAAAGDFASRYATESFQGLQWIARGPDFESTSRVSPDSFPSDLESRVGQAPSAPFSLASTRATALGSGAVASGSASTTPGSASTTPGEAAAAQVTAASSRAVLASLVSNQIISGRPAADEIGRSVHSIDNPPGWQAIGEELSQRLDKCEALINRRAYFSAREDAEAAMLYLVRVLDLMSNHYHSEPAWHAASKAMSEAEDFSSAQRLTSDSDFLRRIILSHETPVLKDADATTMAPLAAAQHYRQYAEEKLLEAAQGHPWASEVLYALGRSYQSQADASHSGLQQNLRWRAIILYRGARGIAPANAQATNQLGFVLLQMDRPADACEALLASIEAAPSLAAYENLVEASRRLADSNTGNWALQQLLAAKTTLPTASSALEFLEVDPRTFAAMSPYSIGPSPQSHDAPAATYRTALSPANY